MLQLKNIYTSNLDVIWTLLAFAIGLSLTFISSSYLSSSVGFPRGVRYPDTGESTRRGKSAIDGIYAILKPQSTIAEQVISRAISNARLVRAFGLSNTFVKESFDVHNAFVAQAKYLLKAAENWPDFLEVCVESVEASLASLRHASTIPFDVLIQGITLRAVLVGFLRVNATPASLDSYHIQKVAELITVLWGLSKSKSPADIASLQPLREQLRVSLTHLGLPYRGISGVDFETLHNPLDFIIPAWETLWRVVALSFAHTYAYKGVIESLEIFRDHPTKHNFQSFEIVKGTPSIEAVVMETMRLFPPSGRIGRAIPQFEAPSFIQQVQNLIRSIPLPISFALNSTGTGEGRVTSTSFMVVKADIEAIQRDTTIWGENSTTYDPMRHHPKVFTPEQKKALIPFGAGSLQCIGAKWAPMAVGVIMAAIADRVDHGLTKEYVLVRGKKMGSRNGWDGWFVQRRNVDDTIQPATTSNGDDLGLAVQQGSVTNIRGG